MSVVNIHVSENLCGRGKVLLGCGFHSVAVACGVDLGECLFCLDLLQSACILMDPDVVNLSL